MAALPLFLDVLAEHQAVLEFAVDGKPAPLPVPHPTRSFWINSPDANPLAKEGSDGPLTHDADICIIGAGITGISAAFHISRLLAETPRPSGASPLSITILEARDFCSGATGRNGGHLTPNTFRNISSYASLHGTEDAVRAIALEEHTASEIVKLIKSTGKEAPLDLVNGSHVTLLFTDTRASLIRKDYEAAKNAGVDLENAHFLSKEQVLETYGAVYPAIRIPGHNLWPLKLVTHLYILAKQISSNSSTSLLKIHTRTPVTAIHSILADSTSSSTSSRRWNLTTHRGDISCSYVLHATNAYASHLLPHMHGGGPMGITPTRGQIIALRAAAPLERLTRASWDGNDGLEYWFPRPVEPNETHPLVILGGGRESTKPGFELHTVDDSVVDGKVGRTLRQFLPAVFPGMYEEGREPEIEWSGIMGYTKTGDPFVGPVLDKSKPSREYRGQYISAGYSGHGMPRAYGCAEAVAQMMVADITDTEWKIPDWLPRHYLTESRFNGSSHTAF